MALIKNTGIFAIGTFGSKILTLLIIPLCTHYIATDDMGIYDMVYTIIALLQPIAVLAIPESLFRWVIDAKADKKKRLLDLVGSLCWAYSGVHGDILDLLAYCRLCRCGSDVCPCRIELSLSEFSVRHAWPS